MMGQMSRLASLALCALALAACGQKGADPKALLAAAKAEQEKGNHGAAIIHLKNVVHAAPDNAEARFQLGMAYTATGDFASAEKELRRAAELRYDPDKVTAPLARAMLAIGEFQKVRDEIRPESVAGPDTQAELIALRGLAELGLRREKEGRALLEQALAKRPDLVDALLGLARLAVVDKKLDDAAALVERAVKAAPRNADAWLLRAELERMRGGEDPAAGYRKAIELNPENVPARLGLISMLLAAGKTEEAEKWIAETRKLAPRNPLVRYTEGLLAFRKKNYPAAREAVLQVLKVAPNHMPSVLLAGSVEYALGAHAQAQTYLGRVLEQAPGNLYARRLLVSSLARTGNTQRAQEVLAPALAQAPNDTMLLSMAGELAMQANDFAKAREYFDKAAKIDPKSAGARTGLAVSRLAGGDAESGLADLEAAVELDSTRYQADILLVTTHLQRSRFDQALKAAQSLEKKQPDNPLTYNLKAAAYLGKKDVASARRELERALELRPTYLPAAVNLAQLDLQEKKPAEARRRLESIVQKDKDNAQALIALANLGPQIGATQKEQIDWLERAGRASPGTVQPKLLLARFHAQAGDTKKALGVAQQAAAASPDNAEVLETLGSIQIAAGEKNQALATFTRLAALQPKAPTAHYRLAVAQSVNGDAASAAGSLRKALELRPDYPEAQAALAELEIRAGRYSQAMEIARQAQKRSAKSPLGHVLEGDVHMAQKQYPQAAKAYDNAFALGRNSALAIKLHAAYTQSGKPGEADARLAQWLKAAPDDVPARLYAADAGLKSKNYKVAIEHYEWLLARQPENVVALNNLAWAYQQVKDKRALDTAERAHKLKPDNPAVADTLGWILVEQGDYKRATALLQKAVAAAPKAPEIRYHLAQAWLKSGDKARAREELERLLATETPFPERADALALLRQLRN